MSLAIKQLRLEKGWTQAELAERSGFDRVATISDLENGHGNPTLLTLQQVADAFGITLPELFVADDSDQGDLEALIRSVRALDPSDRATIRDLILRLSRA